MGCWEKDYGMRKRGKNARGAFLTRPTMSSPTATNIPRVDQREERHAKPKMRHEGVGRCDPILDLGIHKHIVVLKKTGRQC